MPRLTTEQKKEALEHVLVEILDLPLDSPVAKAFEKNGVQEQIAQQFWTYLFSCFLS